MKTTPLDADEHMEKNKTTPQGKTNKRKSRTGKSKAEIQKRHNMGEPRRKNHKAN